MSDGKEVKDVVCPAAGQNWNLDDYVPSLYS